MAQIFIPVKYLRKDKVAKTIAIKDQWGQFQGRVPIKGKHDTTKAMRVMRDVDVNKDGKIDATGGTIRGRHEKESSSRQPTLSIWKGGKPPKSYKEKEYGDHTYYVRGSSRARGYVRRNLD